MRSKKILVVSAISIKEAGPLTVLNKLLSNLSKSYTSEVIVIAIVYKKKTCYHPNIHYIELKNGDSTYAHKLIYQYYVLPKISRRIKSDIWISLEDTTPKVITKKQLVYCHNPLIFYDFAVRDILFSPKIFLFSLLYHFIYKINIHRNNFIIVQQDWLRKEFAKRFEILPSNIIVAYPVQANIYEHRVITENKLTIFFFPSFPRIFKNFEIIGEAVKILKTRNLISKFKVILTISGTENIYSRWIKWKYKNDEIEFAGRFSFSDVQRTYNIADALIFPSKLETWGLPITEFKLTGKPILGIDLPYFFETIGEYDKILTFKTATDLANAMEIIINKINIFKKTSEIKIENPYAENWNELINIMLK